MNEGESSNGSAGENMLSKLTRMVTGEPQTRNQLIDLIRQAHKKHLLDMEALSIIEGALQISDMRVREVMIPRPQMICIDSGNSPKDFLPVIIESQHSRYPVLGEGPDEVLGILLAKDLLPLILDEQKLTKFNIKDHVRKAAIIPESKRLDTLLNEFRDGRNHMAIVVNEYGNISGLVTIEDVLEQIVGEIEDETDLMDEDYIVKKQGNKKFVIKALMPIEEFNNHFGTDFSDDEYETISGVVLQNFGKLPKRNDSIELGRIRFTILNADSRTIRLLKVTVLD